MQRKCYGSTVVSKTISVGSTPTFCDFMKGFTMIAAEVLATILMAPVVLFFGVCFTIATYQLLKEWIDEIKRRN